ncbi:helix-turn-helix domain-containing protein [Dyadobacter sp. BHUBP1]
MLSEKQKAVELYLQEMPVAEIARQFGITISMLTQNWANLIQGSLL